MLRSCVGVLLGINYTGSNLKEVTMKKFDVVVVGGGPAGVTAALSARITYPNTSVALIRKEKIAMIPCGIPYVLHSLNSVDENVLPDSPLRGRSVEIIVDEVLGRDGNVLSLASGEKLEYGKLVIATGSSPVVPRIEGIDKAGVFFVRKDYEYLKKFREAAERARNVAVVGGGYVGVEVADELIKAGKEVAIIELLPEILGSSLDPEFAELVRDELVQRGAKVYTGTAVDSLVGNEKVTAVRLVDGKEIPADMVVISAGYEPNLSLAEKLGLEVRQGFGIVVDEYLRTSEKDVYAVGDCAAKRSSYTGDYSRIMLASTAMAQGRLAGSNLFQIKVLKTFQGTLGSFCTKVGHLAVGVTGLTEEQAKKLKVQYVVGKTQTVDRHPGKLPGASKITMKLVYARYSHVLLGAQVAGGDSVGELVNMLSVVIQNKMTDMEIDALQIGTHPLLTPSPIAYPVINATVDAIMKWYQ